MLKQMINGVSDETSGYVEFGGKKIYNELQIAEEFNKYFVNSIEDIKLHYQSDAKNKRNNESWRIQTNQHVAYIRKNSGRSSQKTTE